MTPRSFLALLVITIIATAAAFWMSVSRDSGTGIRGEGRILFPDLAAQVNDITRVRITRADGTSTLVATTKGDKTEWHLKELYGYPVPLISVRAVAAGIARLAVIEAKTNRRAKYIKVRVEDPARHKGNKKSRAARVELFDKQDAKIADVIIGLEKSTLSGVGELFVRKPDDNRAWLARGKVHVPENRAGWVNQMIVEIDLPRVRETTLNIPGEKPLRVYKNKESEQDFIVDGMPETHELKELFGAEDISRSIQNLAFEDVRPADQIGIDFKATPRARHITFDGLIIDVWLKTIAKKHWIAIRASANPDPQKNDKVDTAKRDAEIEKINNTTARWAYTINAFETKNLFKTMKSLTQPKAGAEKDAKPTQVKSGPEPKDGK